MDVFLLRGQILSGICLPGVSGIQDPQRILKADPMDLSLPSLGRRYKFCLYNSYFLVQDSLWIQQPYQILLPLPVSPYEPFHRLFYEGRSVKFSFFKEILH